MAADSLLLPLLWLFAYAFTTAVGYAFIPFKEHRGVLSANLFTWFWYGLGILVAFLQLWNLFLPLTILTWLCLLPAAVYGAINIMKSDLFKVIGRPGYAAAALWVAVLVFLICSTLNNSFIYDSLVYHFYTLKWFNNYPVTAGMGNLYIYLGLNQSYFLYPSFLNGLWGDYKGACSANGLLVIVICSEIIFSNANFVLQKTKLSLLSGFQLLFLPLCINAGVQNLSSPTPDVFINLLTFRVLSDLISYTEAKKASFQDIFLLCFYCVTGVIMKLSFAGVGLGILTIIAVLIIKNRWGPGLIVRAIVLLSVVFVPWIIRGIISSGYIGFPVSVFGLPVDWKVPETSVEELSSYIKGFARTHLHGEAVLKGTQNYAWFPIWAKRMLSTSGFIIPVFLFLASTVLLKIKKIKMRGFIFILIPVFISIAFWFFTAPDFRFAAFTFWGLGIASLSYCISRLQAKWITRFITPFIFICSIFVIIKNRNKDLEPLGDLPKQNNSVFTTRSGLKINFITNGNSEDDWRIGDCNIPCTVYPDSALSLRGTDIQQGFKKDRFLR